MDILVYGEITQASAQKLAETLNAAPTGEPVKIRVNSPGGDLGAALAMVAAIQRRPGITVAIEGVAASAATLLGCVTHASAAESALLMVHKPWTVTTGNASVLRESADTLDLWEQQCIGLYARKTGKTESTIKRLLSGADHWMTALEAKALGLINEVLSAPPVTALFGSLVPPTALAMAYASALTQASAFAVNPALKAEFGTFETYSAYCRAVAAGRVQGKTR